MQFPLPGFAHSLSVIIIKENIVLVCVDYVLMHNEVTCISGEGCGFCVTLV